MLKQNSFPTSLPLWSHHEAIIDRKTFEMVQRHFAGRKRSDKQELAERIERMDMRDKCIQQFIHDAKQYVEMPKLTPELLRVFIRRIEVYEKFEKRSRTAGNPIIIHYAFQLPEQNGIPAIEVLAQPTAKTA